MSVRSCVILALTGAFSLFACAYQENNRKKTAEVQRVIADAEQQLKELRGQ